MTWKYKNIARFNMTSFINLTLCTGGGPEDGSAEGWATARKEGRLSEGGDQWAAAGNITCSYNKHEHNKLSKIDVFIGCHFLYLPQRLQEAETRNQELSQSVTSATRPLLRQIENLQASLGGQTASWEKLEKSISDRLGKRKDILTVCVKQTISVSDSTPFLLHSGCPGAAGCCGGERAVGEWRAPIHQVPAGLSGVTDLPVPPGEGPARRTAGGWEEQER